LNGRRASQSAALITSRLMDGPEILNSVDRIEKLDKVARRTFGLNDNPYSGFTLNVLNINSLQLDKDRTEPR